MAMKLEHAAALDALGRLELHTLPDLTIRSRRANSLSQECREIDAEVRCGQHAAMKFMIGVAMLTLGCSGDAQRQTSIGPPSAVHDASTTAEPRSYAALVGGEQVPMSSWRFAVNGVEMVYGTLPPSQRKLVAMELLIEREILAQAAAGHGFNVSDQDVDDAIAAGEMYLAGRKLDGKSVYFNGDGSGEPVFAPEYLKYLALRRLGLPSVQSYKEEQRRELMAEFMRARLISSVPISDEQAREHFVMTSSKVSAEYVRFDVRYYQDQLKLTRSMVQDYADSHHEQLLDQWYKVKPRWESAASRVNVRIIKVARKRATAASARKRIAAARAKISGGADFGKVALTTSDDRSASRGGYVGWRSATSIGYGQEVVTACRALSVGELSPIIETPEAYYLVQMDQRSDLGLTFEQKKFDLAIKASPLSIAKARAKAAAQVALSAATSKALAKQFPASIPVASTPISIPPELREQLTPEQLESLMASSKPSSEPVSGAPPSLRSFREVQGDDEFIAGVGRAKELVKALFDEITVGDLGRRVYKVDDGAGFVVVRLTERTLADMDALQSKNEEIKEMLGQFEGAKAKQRWVAAECRKLSAAKAIKLNPELLVSDQGAPLDYEPCSMLQDAP